ncbi:MAG: hypothetical protein K1X57_00005, partial [Gemmataceae bacterium]|nr:hypothetical protein [Gemmataceae bacterium]
DGARLDVLPPVDADSKWIALDEWWFCLPGSRYVGVGGGGRLVEGHTDRPINSEHAKPPSLPAETSDDDAPRAK